MSKTTNVEHSNQTAVSLSMKRDGRTLDHKTLEAIRLMAVEQVREGESVSQVIEAYGFNRTTIYKGIKTALRPGVGSKPLRSTRATGRPRSLTPTQAAQVFRWGNGRDPRQYGLDVGLWTCAIVVELIDQKFGLRLGLSAVGELLAKLGLTQQKPLQRDFGGECQGSVLVQHRRGWAQRGAVHRIAEENDEVPKETQPSGARSFACAQDRTREEIRCIDRGSFDVAFSARLRT